MPAAMGPSRERLLEILERDDAEAQLPITLAHHEPKARVMKDGEKWVIKRLVHDPEATVAAARRAKAEGREFRPDDAWALMKLGAVIVSARTKAELILAIKKMKWTYGNGEA
jgi:hypothetical protein